MSHINLAHIWPTLGQQRTHKVEYLSKPEVGTIFIIRYSKKNSHSIAISILKVEYWPRAKCSLAWPTLGQQLALHIKFPNIC